MEPGSENSAAPEDPQAEERPLRSESWQAIGQAAPPLAAYAEDFSRLIRHPRRFTFYRGAVRVLS